MSFDLQGTINKIRRKGGKGGYDPLNPIYELILNSINAERNNIDTDKNIIININYSTSKIPQKGKEIEIISYIKISDEGIGFNNEQIRSFKTINSTINKSLGCRGNGKFQILRSFHKIKVTSFNKDKDCNIEIELSEQHYDQNNIEGFKDREFTNGASKTSIECFYDIECRKKEFDEPKFIKGLELNVLKDKIQSKLLLKLALLKKEGFNIIINLQDNLLLKNEDIIDLENCLDDGETNIDIIKEPFNIYHIITDKIKTITNENRNCILWVADNIEVKKDNTFFKDKPKHLFANNEELRYICVVESEYLDRFASDDRTDFDIDEDSFDKIDYFVKQRILNKLKTELQDYYNTKETKINNVKAKYPFLKDIELEYQPEDTEEVIAEKGYIQSVKNEFKIVNALEKKIKDFESTLTFKKQVTTSDLFSEQNREEELKKQSSDIANEIPLFKKHILSRTISEEYIILKQIEECIKQEGAEHYIHNIVFPRFNAEKKRGIDIKDKTLDDVKKDYDNSNLWLIDDKYIGYNYQYLASELEIQKFDERMLQASDIKEKYKDNRPDICVFQATENDNSEPVVIIEFKAPSSKKKVSEAVEQTKDYARIMSSISDNKYSRFTLLIVQPIEEIKSANDWLNAENWNILKQEHHYIKTYTINDYNRKEISIVSEVISLRRFAELARKRKERYMKDLGLL